MRDVREETRTKIEQLTVLGYHVKEMWECDWNRMIRTDPQLKKLIDTVDIVTPLNPREAFLGGRTNAIKLHHKVEENKQIKYSDMISLYPCANPECEYPIGHPEFIDQPGTIDISKYYGLVKCKILPPIRTISSCITIQIRLQTPVSTMQNMRAATDKTTTNKRSEKCPHSAEERSLTGTWTTFELQKAIEKGNVIAYIYEIWHFKERSNQLFQPYIKTFMKIKQEASGWPAESDTDEKKKELSA